MLSQELRPKRWEDVAGQKENVNILKAIVKNPENSPKCLIFQGAFGSGKCVVGDTRVETSLGYVRIMDILGDKEPRFDSDGFMDISDYDIRVLGGRKATHFYYITAPFVRRVAQQLLVWRGVSAGNMGKRTRSLCIISYFARRLSAFYRISLNTFVHFIVIQMFLLV